MRFKRKIAAVLAFVMMFGAISTFSVSATPNHPDVGTTQARGIGFQGSVMQDLTLGLAEAGIAQTPVPTNGIDILIPTAALTAGGVLQVSLGQGATWNFGAVLNDARVIRPATDGQLTSTNFGFRSGNAFPFNDAISAGGIEGWMLLDGSTLNNIGALVGSDVPTENFSTLTNAQQNAILNFLNGTVVDFGENAAAAPNDAPLTAWFNAGASNPTAFGNAISTINGHSTGTVNDAAVAAYLFANRATLAAAWVVGSNYVLDYLVNNPPDFATGAFEDVTQTQWETFAAALSTFLTSNFTATAFGLTSEANMTTVITGAASVTTGAGALHDGWLDRTTFDAWFNTNRASMAALVNGGGGAVNWFAGNANLPGTGAGIGNNVAYTGTVNEDGEWTEIPYVITNATTTGSVLTIQLPSIAQLGGGTAWSDVIAAGAYLRLPVVAVVPEGQNSVNASFGGGGWANAVGQLGMIQLITSGGAPAGGVFRVDLNQTNLANLTERDVIRQPMISINEQNTGNFLTGNVNDPLRGFYLSLPGHYVWANATALGNVQADHRFNMTNAVNVDNFTVTNANNLGMNGVGVNLLNFGAANQPFRQYLHGDWLAGGTTRPFHGAQAFGGVWPSHIEALQAIVQNTYNSPFTTTAWHWLQNNANVVNGIVVNLGEGFAASHPVRNTNYAFLSHSGSQINVILGATGVGAVGQGSRAVQLTNLAIGHFNVNSPVTGNVDVTIGNNILGQNNIGNLGANTNIPAAQVISATPANPLVLRTGVFAAYGLTFERAGGTVGEVTNIVAGRTYTPGAWQRAANTVTNTVAMNVGDFAGRTARVDLTDIVSGSGFGVREYTFAATDAEGNILPDVKIAGVTFNTTGTGGNGRGIATTTFYNIMGTGTPARQWNIVGQGPGANANFTGQANNAISPDPTVSFSLDGHQVAVQNLRANVLGWDNAQRPLQSDRIQVQATFFLSVDPNFEGSVYISVNDDRNVDMQWRTDFISNDGILHVANVTRPVDVSVTPTTVNVGFLSHQVGNIVITENTAGALRQGGYIEIGLGEMAQHVSPWSQIGFNAVTMNNVTVEGHVNPNMRTGLNVSTQPDGVIRINITRASVGTPSTITLSGLTVQTPQTGLIGQWDLHLRGSAIMDNDTWTINRRNVQTTLGNPLLGTNETGNRRYGFTRGLIAEDYFTVTDVTPGITTLTPGALTRFELNSPTVQIAGQTRTMTNVNGVVQPVQNIGGRNFMPLRGVAQLYDGASVDWNGATGAVTVVVAGRTIVFTVGSLSYTVNGETFTLVDEAAMPRNIGGTVFVSIAALGHALGVNVSYQNVDGGQIIWFNNAGVGTAVPAPQFGTNNGGNGYDNGDE
jgi:hypothetical protein